MPSLRDRQAAEFAGAMIKGSVSDQLFAYLKARTALPGTPSKADMMVEQFGKVVPASMYYSSFDDDNLWAVLNANTQKVSDTIAALQGTKCMRMTSINAAGTIGIQSLASAGGYLPVEPGKTYGMRCYIYSPVTARQSRVSFPWLDKNDAVVSTGTPALTSTVVGQWTKFTGTAVCPDGLGVQFLRPRVSITSTVLGEEHYVDDLIVYITN